MSSVVKCPDCGGPLHPHTAGTYLCRECEEVMLAEDVRLTAGERGRVRIMEYEKEQEDGDA